MANGLIAGPLGPLGPPGPLPGFLHKALLIAIVIRWVGVAVVPVVVALLVVATAAVVVACIVIAG